jgi:hypothetical protein
MTEVLKSLVEILTGAHKFRYTSCSYAWGCTVRFSLSPEHFLAGSADVPNKGTKTSQLNFMQALSQEDADEALLFLWVALSDVDGSSLGGRRAAWNGDAGANGDDNNAGSVAV